MNFLNKINKKILLISFLFFSFLSFTPAITHAAWTNIDTKATVAKTEVTGATGTDVLVAYAGYSVTASGTKIWAQALVDASLKSKGVGTIYAVVGPNPSDYSNREISNTALVADLVSNYKTGSRIFVICHSSGSYPAVEFLGKLNLEASKIGKSVILFNIDGDAISASVGAAVRSESYGVVGKSGSVYSRNYNAAGSTGTKLEYEVDTAGCSGSVSDCIHMRLINKLSSSAALTPSNINSGYGSITTSNLEFRYLNNISPSRQNVPSTYNLEIKIEGEYSKGSSVQVSANNVNLTDCISDTEKGITCSYKINADSNVILKEINTGGSFLGWDGACRGTSQICSFKMTANLKVVASFKKPDATVGNTNNNNQDNTTNNNTGNINTSSGSGGGLVPCSGSEDCNWNSLLVLINNIVIFVLFKLAVPIAAIMFAYAGILLLTSGGDPAQKTKAKKIFTGVVIGIVIAAAAWLIVHLIVSILGCSQEACGWIGF